MVIRILQGIGAGGHNRHSRGLQQSVQLLYSVEHKEKRRRGINKEKDLLVIALISLFTIPVVLLSSGALRVVLGLPLLLFFPGYVLLAAMFTRKESLGSVERVALSFGLSIAVVPLIGLLLNYTPWGIRLNPVLISIVSFILIMCGIAWYRRGRLEEEERFRVAFQLKRLSWQGQSRLDKVLSVLLVLAIVGAIGTLGYVIVTPKAGEKFSEFYVLGTEGKAAGYSTELELGERGEIILGIVNHEQEETDYRVEVLLNGEIEDVDIWIGDEVVSREGKPEGLDRETVEIILWEEKRQGEGEKLGANILDITALGYEEKWEGNLFYEPLQTGYGQKLEFLLFYSKLRQGHHFRSTLDSGCFTDIALDEAEGTVEVSLDNKSWNSHSYRLEILQHGDLITEEIYTVTAGEMLEEEIQFTPGESILMLYEDGELVLEDKGAELSLHLWLDVN